MVLVGAIFNPNLNSTRATLGCRLSNLQDRNQGLCGSASYLCKFLLDHHHECDILIVFLLCQPFHMMVRGLDLLQFCPRVSKSFLVDQKSDFGKNCCCPTLFWPSRCALVLRIRINGAFSGYMTWSSTGIAGYLLGSVPRCLSLLGWDDSSRCLGGVLILLCRILQNLLELGRLWSSWSRGLASLNILL